MIGPLRHPDQFKSIFTFYYFNKKNNFETIRNEDTKDPYLDR